MCALIKCRGLGLFFRSSVLMEKRVNFTLSPGGSETSFSGEDVEEIKNKIKNFIPVLSEEKHKGSCGRIGIIGGSPDYSGAPYFAGIAALKLGADLVHVFCCKDAAIPIKSYSPELMVHPILDDPDSVKAIEPLLQNLHALLIGPGLGKCTAILNNVGLIITLCKNKKKNCLPLIIDADGLHLIAENPELVENYNGPLIFTPNANEYNKLATKIQQLNCYELAAHFNAVIVKKGFKDVIQNGVLINVFSVPSEKSMLLCKEFGSFRRCGGQGDVLAGFITTFVAWYEINLKSKRLNYTFLHSELSSVSNKSKLESFFKGYSYAAYAGCLMTRKCNNAGFKIFGRSLTTSDMIGLIGEVFVDCFEQ